MRARLLVFVWSARSHLPRRLRAALQARHRRRHPEFWRVVDLETEHVIAMVDAEAETALVAEAESFLRHPSSG